jgi:hypothetical protein
MRLVTLEVGTIAPVEWQSFTGSLRPLSTSPDPVVSAFSKKLVELLDTLEADGPEPVVFAGTGIDPDDPPRRPSAEWSIDLWPRPGAHATNHLAIEIVYLPLHDAVPFLHYRIRTMCKCELLPEVRTATAREACQFIRAQLDLLQDSRRSSEVAFLHRRQGF